MRNQRKGVRTKKQPTIPVLTLYEPTVAVVTPTYGSKEIGDLHLLHTTHSISLVLAVTNLEKKLKPNARPA